MAMAWKILRIVAALCLSVSVTLGAFYGVKGLVIKADIDQYYAEQRSPVVDDFTQSVDFYNSLEQFMELVEIYLDVADAWPQWKSSETPAAVDRKGNALMMEELLNAPGVNREKYDSYLSNYLKNQNSYYEADIHLLDLTQVIRSLKNMVVIDGDKIYYSPKMQETMGEQDAGEWKKKEQKLLKYLQESGRNHVLRREDLELPGFEQTSEGQQKYEVQYGEDTVVSFEPRNQMEKILFQKFSEEEQRQYVWELCYHAAEDKSGENQKENKSIKKIFRRAYRKACMKDYADQFYLTTDQNGANLVAVDSQHTGEETKYAMDAVFYLENGKRVTAEEIVSGDVDSFERIYVKTMADYLEGLAEKNWKDRKTERGIESMIGSDVLLVDRSAAEEYAAFLNSCYRCLKEEWKDTPFLFLLEQPEDDGISIGEGNRIGALLKKFDEGKSVALDDSMTREEEKALMASRGDIVYVSYHKNGEIFRTNLTCHALPEPQEMEDYFRRLSDYDSGNVSLLAVGVDMKKVKNGTADHSLSPLYQKFQSDQKRIEGLTEQLWDDLYSFLWACGMMIVSFLLLAWMTGHQEGSAEIVLLPVDKICLELMLAAEFVAAFAFFAMVYGICANLRYNSYDTSLREQPVQILAIVVLSGLALFLAALLLSLIKRIKARAFWSTSVVRQKFGGRGYIRRFFHGTAGKLRDILEVLYSLTAWKRYLFVAAVNLLGGFVLFIAIFDNVYYGGITLLFMMADVLCLLALDIRCIWRCLKNAVADERICRGAEQIAAGNLSYKISAPEGVSKEQAELVDVINHIGQGLERAVEDSVRNERMKTELITNVSHDIKTPLTSVINYVDLMKREKIENERVKEYLEVLDQKSQRLKVLIEDLVEASKASSGALELEITPLNFNELVHQTNGEFEEKFKNAGLTLISDIPQESVVFQGDGRRVYRVLENLYANVAKYALAGTRVYVSLSQKRDTETERGGALFTIKNISRDVLNVTSQDLTERFVRGEQSRTTEGSGLGLSIAKSLTERMNGELTIELDGDLFRVKVWFPQ